VIYKPQPQIKPLVNSLKICLQTLLVTSQTFSKCKTNI